MIIFSIKYLSASSLNWTMCSCLSLQPSARLVTLILFLMSVVGHSVWVRCKGSVWIYTQGAIICIQLGCVWWGPKDDMGLASMIIYRQGGAWWHGVKHGGWELVKQGSAVDRYVWLIYTQPPSRIRPWQVYIYNSSDLNGRDFLQEDYI